MKTYLWVKVETIFQIHVHIKICVETLRTIIHIIFELVKKGFAFDSIVVTHKDL